VSTVARSDNGLTYVLAGDLTYRKYLLMDDMVDGMTENPAVSLASQRAMKQFSQGEPTVLLLARDPDAAKRLAEGMTTRGCRPKTPPRLSRREGPGRQSPLRPIGGHGGQLRSRNYTNVSHRGVQF
jgi:hypothetical protein